MKHFKILFFLAFILIVGVYTSCKNAAAASEDVTGVSDTEIVIGSWGPMTGPAALWGNILKGMDAYFKMVNDEEEAWYTVRQAMQTLQYANADQVARCYDRLAYWLKHDDWWMRHGAMTALTPLAVHKDY